MYGDCLGEPVIAWRATMSAVSAIHHSRPVCCFTIIPAEQLHHEFFAAAAPEI